MPTITQLVTNDTLNEAIIARHVASPLPETTLWFELCDMCDAHPVGTFITGETLRTEYEAISNRIATRRNVYVYACQPCLNAYFSLCGTCEEYMLDAAIEDCSQCNENICERCFNASRHECRSDDNNQENGESGERLGKNHNENTVLYIDKKDGALLTASRAVGVEIECYTPNMKSALAIQGDLPLGFGIGTDGSLNTNGIEIRTPRLSGGKGEHALKDVCKLLAKGDAYIDRTCGLHVHISARDYQGSTAALRALWLTYLVFEDVLLSFLPCSRRSNRYCINLRDRFHIEEIQEAKTRSKQETIWYREMNSEKLAEAKKARGSDTRYVGLNLHSMFHAGHAEVRYHSGTTNFEKIAHWAALNQWLFDTAQNIDIDALLAARHEIRIMKKTRLFFWLFTVPENIRVFFLARQKLFTRDSRDENATEADIAGNNNDDN